jgi:CheY-like chemotaxis protein
MNQAIKICIIDDDAVYKYTITKILKQLKCVENILSFSDGEEALDFLKNIENQANRLPDLILLDINMPVMDGFQFMQEFCEFNNGLKVPIPVYLVTSSIDSSDIEQSKQIPHIRDYITKPIRAEKIKEIIQQLGLLT